ncbi:hypothetical protein Goshw_015012 [Gossypium schwendimanii]|uniref:Xrn1 helical domain-containing protein n=1 Tax=Gossypium schwendimanii TaxID=34291 RepID=A0A7J9N8N9_GOSSC|nr:hypothetical protein [Gossypium schwendimanii]
MLENKEELEAKLKELIHDKTDVFNSKDSKEDKIKLGEPGWKERYYQEKFLAETPEEMETTRKDVVLKFTEGLCWVMHYYYEGVCSWRWFYPYHYAPFASDLKDLGQLNIQFELGSPFKPFNQLLGVFPAASSHALPEQYRKLMTDPNSPIIDFYPTDLKFELTLLSDFEVDMDGKRFSWQGIAKLPFIDEERLLTEVAKIEHTLTEEEARRNSTMCDMLFVAASHRLSEQIFSLDNRCKRLTERQQVEVEEVKPDLRFVQESLNHPTFILLDYACCCGSSVVNNGVFRAFSFCLMCCKSIITSELLDELSVSDGMNGYIFPCAGDTHPPIFRSPIKDMEDILANEVICCIYRTPKAHKHIPHPPAGVIFPPKMIQLSDLKPKPLLWHEDSGRRRFQNGRFAAARHLVEGSMLRSPVESAGNYILAVYRYLFHFRYNPPGSISGRKLGEASHRLIANSLKKLKVDRTGFSNNVQAPPPSIATAPHIPPFNSHVNNGSLNQGQAVVAPSEQDYSRAGSQKQPRRAPPEHDSRAGYPLSQNLPFDFPNAQSYYPYPICVPGSYLHYPPNHQNGGVRLITSPMAQISAVPGPEPHLSGKKRRYNTRYQANLRYQENLSGSYPQCGGIMAPQGNLDGSAVIPLLHHPYPQPHPHLLHEQGGTQPHRANQHQRGNQQQGDNPFSVLDR